jgi:hypothetical protein
MGIGIVGERESIEKEEVVDQPNQCAERHRAQAGNNFDYNCGEPQNQHPQGNLVSHWRYKPIEPRTDVSFGPPHD